jgi:hypothetical protein
MYKYINGLYFYPPPPQYKHRTISKYAPFILRWLIIFTLFLAACKQFVDTSVVAKPFAIPLAGTYTSVQMVTLFCATGGATIYYTLDGTEPSAASILYTKSIPVIMSTTIKAVAVKENNTSAVLTAAYSIQL